MRLPDPPARARRCVRLTRVARTAAKVAVVGHVEWVQFARVSHVPRAGEVMHARDPFEEPAGGGAVVAVQLARLAGEPLFVTALGERLEPIAADRELPWAKLAEMDAVYFTAGDHGALRAARAGRVLVANPRARDALGHGVPIDALVLSEKDEVELRAAERVDGEAELVVLTEGERGGSYRTRAGESGRWKAVALPVSYTHLRAHETVLDLVCRLLLE